MKEICQCNCSLTAGYRTPWCDLLKSLNGTSGEVLHLWYKLDWLREEISKRTAFLGKLRRTDEATHLLDLIKLTADEDKMFVPFAKAAMGDVAEILAMHSPRQEQTFFWNEGKTTVIIPYTPEGYLHLSDIATSDVDADGYIIVDEIPVDAEGNIMIAETDATDENYITKEIVTFKKDDYVEYNGQLYKAIEDGDSNDFVNKLVPTEDYRKSIHFGIVWKCNGSNINMVEPLDTAIFEALVARIIYKWLQYSYPDEAPRYLAEWQECVGQIKTRVRFLDGPQIVNRIPRLF